MRLSLRALQEAARETGFGAEPLEKAARLLDLLAGIRAHPYLKDRLVLKGGTALNLFVFDIPRLSVDIDLNYVGAADRATMLEERPKIEQALSAVCDRSDVGVRRVPSEHAGGKWRLRYTDVAGRPGNLELDVNFMLRLPLWPPWATDSRPLGPFTAASIPVLDIHELAAGKLAALFSRTAPRDAYDVCRLFEDGYLDTEKLRLAFVAYGGMSRRDWRTVSLDDIDLTAEDVTRQLLPMLRAELAPKSDQADAWARELVASCRQLSAALLPLAPRELDFLDALNDRGQVLPELLTEDPKLQETLRSQPMLQWKALNVREH